MERWKQNERSTNSSQQRAKEHEIKHQQTIVRKLKTQTATLHNLKDVVYDLARAVKNPLNECKRCPKHCLFGLAKDLPSKAQLKKSLSSKLKK